MTGSISNFLKHHYRHFNAATVIDASESYKNHLNQGGKMFLAMAGAMSTAEIGLSLAEMIRKNKVHGISCTGANLEEDLFNLVAHDHYKRIPNYRDLTPQDEKDLLDRKLNRVTDTCIPEEEAMRKIEGALLPIMLEAEKKGEKYFPHEYLYKLLDSWWSDHTDWFDKKHCQIDPKDSWVVAAWKKRLPIFVPGWEDSTLGNMYAAAQIKATTLSELLKGTAMKTGIDYLKELVNWYKKESSNHKIGFFQIGGGIAGDFAICAVPLINQDLLENYPLWSYFCQISDSTTSYGSYSGCAPREKITWGKLSVDTPMYTIESDATIVVPLIFAYVLNL